MRIVAILLLAACGSAAPAPRPTEPVRTYTADDLASPDPAVRAAAAAQIRASYTRPSRAPWDTLVASIREGDALESVLAQLPDREASIGGACGGGGCTQSWQLDSVWALVCGYLEPARTIIDCAVAEQPAYVWVEPPAGYSGVWTYYFANGNPSGEMHYDAGERVGIQTSYYPDGGVSQTQLVGPDLTEEVGYHPSGAMKVRGRYRNGEGSVGAWVWLREDGSIESWRNDSADELASPDQAVRDRAAEHLRATWTPPPREAWDALAGSTHERDTKQSVVDKVPVEAGGGGGSGGISGMTWQLDDGWALACSFWVKTWTLRYPCTVEPSVRIVWVEPPAGFTGTWTTYHANGQPFRRAAYRDGQHDGTNTEYRADDGTRSTEQTYAAGKYLGETYWSRDGAQLDAPALD